MDASPGRVCQIFRGLRPRNVGRRLCAQRASWADTVGMVQETHPEDTTLLIKNLTHDTNQ